VDTIANKTTNGRIISILRPVRKRLSDKKVSLLTMFDQKLMIKTSFLFFPFIYHPIPKIE
ncbi:MAG: hypothetical protein ABIJ34_02235, partial [archaeon]